MARTDPMTAAIAGGGWHERFPYAAQPANVTAAIGDRCAAYIQVELVLGPRCRRVSRLHRAQGERARLLLSLELPL